jgi:PIN domain nuclease of toxin-antitoxin system
MYITTIHAAKTNLSRLVARALAGEEVIIARGDTPVVRLLLDAHTLFWWLADDPRLSKPAMAAIEDTCHVVYVSAATAWEIATKTRVGKLVHHADVAEDITRHLAEQGFLPLDVTVSHGRQLDLGE